jgi:small subunit ribosomal protein S1
MIGDTVVGRVCRASTFGVFVEVAPGVEGLCHNSEIPYSPHRKKDEPPLPIGKEMPFKVIKLNESEKKIGLSARAVADDQERGRLEDYHRQAAAATLTIEEAMNTKDTRD